VVATLVARIGTFWHAFTPRLGDQVWRSGMKAVHRVLAFLAMLAALALKLSIGTKGANIAKSATTRVVGRFANASSFRTFWIALGVTFSLA